MAGFGPGMQGRAVGIKPCWTWLRAGPVTASVCCGREGQGPKCRAPPVCPAWLGTHAGHGELWEKGWGDSGLAGPTLDLQHWPGHGA